MSVAVLLDSAANPLAPTVRESIADALSSPERERFLAHLAREVLHGEPVRRSAVAYLTAVKGH